MEQQDTPMGSTGFGTTSSSDTGRNSGSMSSASTGTEVCASCGRPVSDNNGLNQFLGKIGISDDMMGKIRSSMQNVDVEEYLNTARDFMKSGGDKAKSFTKENPGRVAAGVAILAVGAGLLITALNRD